MIVGGGKVGVTVGIAACVSDCSVQSSDTLVATAGCTVGVDEEFEQDVNTITRTNAITTFSFSFR